MQQYYSHISPLCAHTRTLLLARPSHLALTYASAISKPTSLQQHPTSSARPICPRLPHQRSFSTSLPSIIIRRHASTAPAAAAAQSSSSASADKQLTWNDFLRLRRIRRFYNLGASIGTSFASLITGMALLSQQNLQALGQQLFGLDPFVLLGICATSFWGIGWLMGPLVGTGVFKLLNRSRAKGMAAKEKDFFERIKKYRVDPSSSSMQNPPPDYYGEKITSVAGYRRWLKDQRAFNKKRQSFL